MLSHSICPKGRDGDTILFRHFDQVKRVEKSPNAKQYKIISLVPPTFHQSLFFLIHSPFHFTPKGFLSLLHSFHLIFPKTLNQFCTPTPYFLLPFSMFFSPLYIFSHSFFLFIVVIICYICAFVLFSYLKLGDLSTTLEMTVLGRVFSQG